MVHSWLVHLVRIHAMLAGMVISPHEFPPCQYNYTVIEGVFWSVSFFSCGTL
jgi:hypothetical protein